MIENAKGDEVMESNQKVQDSLLDAARVIFACREAIRLTDERSEEFSRSESRKSPSRRHCADGREAPCSKGGVVNGKPAQFPVDRNQCGLADGRADPPRPRRTLHVALEAAHRNEKAPLISM